jgi:AraC-like DNA-binding protein
MATRGPHRGIEPLTLAPYLGLDVVSCGLFVSSGNGSHPDRILDNYELVVVRRGTLSLWEEGARFDVPPGHALLLYPGRRHRAAMPFERELSFYWIHFKVKAPRKSDFRLQLQQLVRVQRPECVAELFHRYLDDQEAQRLEPHYASLLLLQILYEVGRAPEPRAARGSVLTGRAETFIVRHLSEELSTSRVARELRINPDYLNRAFRNVYRMTLTEYIHRRRLTDAAALLRDSTDAIAEIAVACGFKSIGHFRRLFERHRGVSPGAYRRLMARAYVNTR